MNTHRQSFFRAATILTFLLGINSRSTLAFQSTAKGSPSLGHLFSSPHHLVRNIGGRDAVHEKSTWSNGRRYGRSIGTSSSALAATPMLPPSGFAAIGSGVARFYKAFPLVAGFLTASIKAGFADRLAQRRDVSTTEFDTRRNLAMILYSGTVLGILCEIMYNRIFPLLFGTADKCMYEATKKTLFDGFVNAPLIWLPMAYIVQALVFRYPKREAVDKYLVDAKENGLLTKYWSLWLPVSMVNFLFVPAHFRVLVVASVSFFWMIILSIVSNAKN